MELFRAYQKTRFFLAVNIVGLAVGLAAAIMLVLFVINEYSYDRHFENADRIVTLYTVINEPNGSEVSPITLRTAYSELPAKVPGIEASAQIFRGWEVEARHGDELTQGLNMLFVDPEYFKVFETQFVEGSEQNALAVEGSLVITRPRAEAVFGSAEAAMGKVLTIQDTDYTVTAVVEPLPRSTHFTFDIMAPMGYHSQYGGLEYFTFYMIEPNQSVDEVRAAIAKEYITLLEPFREYFTGEIYGDTDMLTDIYLRGKADWTLGERNTMGFIWMLSALAFFILAFAVTNFVNLFSAQGETRMKEIGMRKSLGAQPRDLVRQFFGEVGAVVAVAFVLGMVLAVQLTPYFGKLIGKDIDTVQFFNPVFMACMAALLVATVVLSASYTSFYLSRLNPLDILAKRTRFSRGRLTTAIVCFQSMVTIVLLSMIIVVNRQAAYLKDIPVGYNTDNVMVVPGNTLIRQKYDAVRQELLALPMVEAAAGTEHKVGSSGSYSGQGIKLLNSTEKSKYINEYRILPGFGEMIGYQMAEGEFFTDDTPGHAIVLNEAAVEMLGLVAPVAGQQVDYYGETTITGVVRDFIYDDPSGRVQPLAFARPFRGANYIYVRLREGTGRLEAQNTVQAVLRRFDPDYILSPVWSEDIYEGKFAEINNQGRIIFVGSLLSIFLAMLGLLAIHLYSAMRRTKEIAIRRINGATRGGIFALLSRDMLRWILLAGVVAVPVAWWLAVRMFSAAENHISLNWAMFVAPIVIQMVVALAVTSGVSVRVSSTNPVESLKFD